MATNDKPWQEKPAPAKPVLPTRETCEPGSIEWAWLDFCDAHPAVLDRFCKLATLEACTQTISRNVSQVRLSAKGIWEQLRAELGPQGIELNNNHTALYARAAIERYPHLGGCFRLRVRASEKAAT